MKSRRFTPSELALEDCRRGELLSSLSRNFSNGGVRCLSVLMHSSLVGRTFEVRGHSSAAGPTAEPGIWSLAKRSTVRWEGRSRRRGSNFERRDYTTGGSCQLSGDRGIGD